MAKNFKQMGIQVLHKETRTHMPKPTESWKNKSHIHTARTRHHSIKKQLHPHIARTQIIAPENSSSTLHNEDEPHSKKVWGAGMFEGVYVTIVSTTLT